MILLLTLTIVVAVLMFIGYVATSVIGAAGLLVFGDAIICAVLIVLLIRYIVKKQKENENQNKKK